MIRSIWLLLLLFSLLPLFSYEEEGIASWYGPNFQGKKTANGEIFDTEELTAAHKTLPFDTMVEVTNLSNGKSVILRINDRGPYVGDRLIDLSRKGAEAIGMLDSGTAPVQISTLDPSVKAIDFSKPVTFTIQIASFTDLINALNTKKELVKAGFNPRASLSNEGATRLFLSQIPASECYNMVKELESHGWKGLVIRQEK
ncbi:MAG: septal ring lytic transglycosylase RlpA family protein [Spirochaetales bacterium]|nr:septal ring lytic transglycosylase RlpA family protein [Spirochaetales bacterium]